jgi:hypothetical protein
MEKECEKKAAKHYIIVKGGCPLPFAGMEEETIKNCMKEMKECDPCVKLFRIIDGESVEIQV